MSHSSITYDFLISDHISREYYYDHQNDKQLQSNSQIYAKNATIKSELPENIIQSSRTNNFLYLHESGQQPDNIAIQTSVTESTEPSHIVGTSNTDMSLTSEMIDNLFIYDPALPYRSPQAHTLEESPFKWIIKQDNNQYYYCTLHSNEKNINLETIEHHIIYSDDSETHKTEIKKILGV